ncbi:MAG: helix-turn-helix transcriptional regulator [Rubrobacter sp.]|nr:helix-turn-helix transcriptional regulator [Rubrobacter sp.]
MVDANRSWGRSEGASEEARAGLRDGVPRIPKLRSRELRVFGAIEVAYHQFVPGEIETLPFKGPVINLHLSAPHRLVQRQNGLAREGLVASNDIAVMPAGTPGYWRTDTASEDMSILLEERFFRRVAAEAGADPDRIEVVPLFSAPDPQIERIGLSFLSEMETEGLGGELFTESLANVLALHLLRSHSSLGRGSRQRIGREDGFSKRALAQATDYINDNLSRKLTLTEIAGTAHISPHHFARSFKAATGFAPHQYIVRRRVERARSLLTDTDLTIAEIAKAVGFSNQSHLAYHVRRLLGVSPRALRQEDTR